MSYLDAHELLQTQDTWKRSQIRIPLKLYGAINDYAEKNNMSLNTALIELLDKGLSSIPNNSITLADIMKEIQSLKNEKTA